MEQWAHEHWFLTFVLAYCALTVVSSIITRIYRVIMVLARGWPTHPLMDADGDIVHPERKDEFN